VTGEDTLERFRRATRKGIFLDFDGTLSEIVPRPELAEPLPGAWVEDKGGSLAVHYRAAPDQSAAERLLRPALEAIAAGRSLIVLPGKMVLELAPADTPGKGALITREVGSRRLDGVLFAGDDRADLPAFSALDDLRGEAIATVKVAVRSEETPRELLDQADLVVERPRGLLELLTRL
jgi:trehalose 6-phosphate phosphatase